MTETSNKEFTISIELEDSADENRLLSQIEDRLREAVSQKTFAVPSTPFIEEYEVSKPLGGMNELVVHIKLVAEVIAALGGAATATALLLRALRDVADAAREFGGKGPVKMDLYDRGYTPVEEVDLNELVDE